MIPDNWERVPELLKEIRYHIRSNIAEIFVLWALRIAPKGYRLSIYEAAIDAYHKRGAWADVEKDKADATRRRQG